jgi:hypothetical protein
MEPKKMKECDKRISIVYILNFIEGDLHLSVHQGNTWWMESVDLRAHSVFHLCDGYAACI